MISIARVNFTVCEAVDTAQDMAMAVDMALAAVATENAIPLAASLYHKFSTQRLSSGRAS